MKQKPGWPMAVLVAIMPLILLAVQSGAAYGVRCVQLSMGIPLQQWIDIAVYTVLGVLEGYLATRLQKEGQRRAGAVAFVVGFILLAACGILFALYRQGSAPVPAWLHNLWAVADQTLLYWWGGLYLVQLVSRTLPQSGQVRPRPAGEAAAAAPRRVDAAAMVGLIALPAAALVASALRTAWQADSAAGGNIWVSLLLGALSGAAPLLCRREQNRLRCAVALTFGLAGAVMVGMMQSAAAYLPAPPLPFLQHLRQGEIFLWIGLYLFLMVSFLRQGYRDKQKREAEEDEP